MSEHFVRDITYEGLNANKKSTKGDRGTIYLNTAYSNLKIIYYTRDYTECQLF